MSHDLAIALLRSIIDAQGLFLDAAELVSLGAITQERYQSAADRFHDSIDRAAALVAPTVETRGGENFPAGFPLADSVYNTTANGKPAPVRGNQ